MTSYGRVDIIGKAQDQTELYGKIYNDNKKRCRWMSFFDFDEFLVIKDDNRTNLTIQKYFLEPKFAKCDVILINWLVYSDNGLIRYDNRSMNERFTEPLFYHQKHRFLLRSVLADPFPAVSAKERSRRSGISAKWAIIGFG